MCPQVQGPHRSSIIVSADGGLAHSRQAFAVLVLFEIVESVYKRLAQNVLGGIEPFFIMFVCVSQFHCVLKTVFLPSGSSRSLTRRTRRNYISYWVQTVANASEAGHLHPVVECGVHWVVTET